MNSIGITMRMICVLIAVLAGITAFGVERMCLNGHWQFEPQQEYAKPQQFTQQIIVPSFWNHPEAWGYPEEWREVKQGWLRRTVEIPDAWRGRRVHLRFDRLGRTSEVYVNGRHMANHWDFTNPLQVDITAEVRWGETNDILVGVRERMLDTGVALTEEDRKQPLNNFQPGGTPGEGVKLLVPYGMHFAPGTSEYGITRDAWLIATQPVYISNTFVQPSVRKHTLRVDYEVTNTLGTAQQVTLSAVVTPWKGATRALTLTSRTVTIPAGGTQTVTLVQPWRTPHLWSPDDPYLYALHTTVQMEGDAHPEVATQRFGFREIWTQGRYLFLNGNRLNLRGDTILMTFWGARYLSEPETFRAACALWKRLNVNALRFHGHCSSPEVLNVCDEEGLLVIEESALYGSGNAFATDDPLFWKFSRSHLRNMVREEWNHPSIIVWAVENEMGAFFQGNWEHLNSLNATVRELDSSRLIWHDGFAYLFMEVLRGSPVQGDVHAMHYPPFEMWGIYANVPESSYWVKEVLKRFGKYGERDIPVGLTEYALMSTNVAWDFVGTQYDNCYGTAALTGTREDIYPLWKDHYRMLGFSIRGNRYSDTAVISPFTVVQHFLEMQGGTILGDAIRDREFDWTKPGLKFRHIVNKPYLNAYDSSKPPYLWNDDIEQIRQANHPLLTFAMEHNTRFWSGGKVTKTFVAFNDLYRPSTLTLTVTLADAGGKVIDRHKQRVNIPVGWHREYPVTLTMPEVAAATPAKMHVSLASSLGEAYTEMIPVTIYPQIPVPSFYLYDRLGDTTRALTQAGIAFQPIVDLRDMPRGATLVLAEGSVASMYDMNITAVQDFLTNGGTVVCLRQFGSKKYAQLWDQWATMETGLPLKQFSETEPLPTTIGHVAAPDDPLMAGLKSEDLCFWAPDHAIGVYGLEVKDGATPLVICNRPAGAAQRGLLVRGQLGKGQFYLCQLSLMKALADEPVARLLLSRMVDTYSATR